MIVEALCGSPAQRSAGLQACRLQHDGSMRNRRPRLDRAHYVGLQRYFLTFCTAGRRRRFVQHDVVQMVLDQISQSAPSFDIVVIAYCFMPDHVHLLIEGCSESADAAAFVHQAKQRSGYAFAGRGVGPLWQPSYHDRVLRDDEASLSVTRYILDNPVRAGLVKSPSDYAFSGSSRFTLENVLEAICWQP